jgi:hypothetical protein
MKAVKLVLRDELVNKLVIVLTETINGFTYSCIFVHISHKEGE